MAITKTYTPQKKLSRREFIRVASSASSIGVANTVASAIRSASLAVCGIASTNSLASTSNNPPTSWIKGALSPIQRKFPSRPITLIVPWAAAGSTDITMRILAEQAGRILGQNIIVQNRPGAAGTLGVAALQSAAPDGYTLSQLPQTIYRAPHLQKVTWDPIRDVTPIIQISTATFGVLVPADSPIRSMQDLLALAGQNPDRMTIATNGIGTTGHVLMEDIFHRRKLSFVHVPFKGTAELVHALSSSQIMVGINSTGFAPAVESGKLRLIASFANQRSKRWPDVPTLRELGFGVSALSPYGIGGPAGLTPEIIQVLHDAFRQAMQHPAHLAELAKYDQELSYLASDDYARVAKEQYAAERVLTERLGLARSGG
jgi:tripartite-type tricarboxylate transporter receptor subunit TctC